MTVDNGVTVMARAFALAATVHAGQVRKGSDTPYLAHLLGVAELVVTLGGSEIEVAGALLHDAAEDGGGQARLDDISDQCGDAVAGIVAACSDSYVDTTSGAVKEAWLSRKQRYIDQLRAPDVADGAVLVSVCDKLHNLAATRSDYEAIGEPVWARFKTGWAGQVWYYRALLEVYLACPDHRVGRAGASLRSELERLEAALVRHGHDLSGVEAALTEHG